ncbi:NADH-FMN oxidoreductase RutF, flavin reductase (DIM6/NTAB) family [Arachidicoccus rhizosphaerae]|uniref:NADH-FMN oxidoreductase RutF, flavin reductase (DIM6/NTAB) family n=1 Tax=Arachidicoccus rhizosphaerae TaxID=551991 RepID=A0A1H3XA76_9BACT|nr:flavin reductase family protein [Arachidicoccus rhizosphaerae]SDZ95468.1 NADH-FMN oxidoreductase RutF, flavin reductase (DIM6/NTAB) family [Arachidicoccus rhizosphaerae]
MIRSLDPARLSTTELQSWLQHGIAPRPICFVSTISKAGEINLSPFSFFNLFSTNPPVCIFSPARRVRDNTIKHSLENVMEVGEAVINIVSYSMVQQTSLASTEYPRGVNEFQKAGFTMEPSDLVSPPRVLESPMQLECLIQEIKPLGTGPGAGNLVFAEIIKIHVREEVLNEAGQIDQAKMDLVARLGANWYCRVTAENLFEVEKPLRTMGIGVDSLPEHVRFSHILTGNELGRIGNMEKVPTEKQLAELLSLPEINAIFKSGLSENECIRELHLFAQKSIRENNLEKALAILWLQPPK